MRPPRPISSLLAGAVLCAVAALPLTCQEGRAFPCIPTEEYDPQFAGFALGEASIESGSYSCESSNCLINHFQGRVTCPLGQPALDDPDFPGRRACDGPLDARCAKVPITGLPTGETCVLSATLPAPCTTDDDCLHAGDRCEPEGHFCACDPTSCPDGFACDASDSHCKAYVCHEANNCQQAENTDAENEGKGCCVPGTDTPVRPAVLRQCEDGSKRTSEDAVYCSCRCGVAEGAKAEPDFDFCECDDGFACSEIRKDVGLGGSLAAGKYCIREGTAFVAGKWCSDTTPSQGGGS